MIADDDEAVRSLLFDGFRRDGYDVIEAIDGAEALSYVAGGTQQAEVDLVIADVRMPRLTGLQLLASEAGTTVPIILITAFGDPTTHARARSLGAVAVLDKPFDFDELRRLVKQTIQAVNPGACAGLAGVVHDLKNPLNVIRLEIELVKHLTEEVESPQLHGVLERLDRNLVFMDGLVCELLDAAVIEDGFVELRRCPCDLGGFLEDAVDRSVSTRDRVRIRLDLRDTVTVDIDAARLERVIENLVQNAFKYSPPDSTLAVRLEGRGKLACVSVIDSGAGLTAEDARTVFDKYRRGRASRGIQGAGLGLYTSRKIVEAHGGRIGVEPGAGCGSRFFFELPIRARA